MQSFLCIPRSFGFNQPQIENSIFRASYMYCSMPFHIRDLSILGFGHLWGRGVLECSAPMDSEGWLGESKVIHRFSTAWGEVV